jgi:hypothetical protein
MPHIEADATIIRFLGRVQQDEAVFLLIGTHEDL